MHLNDPGLQRPGDLLDCHARLIQPLQKGKECEEGILPG
jgi:hypothetical protein